MTLGKRIQEFEDRIKMLENIVSSLCEQNGTTFRDEKEYYEKLKKSNIEFAEKHKTNEQKAV